jgi:hypothetical protein
MDGRFVGQEIGLPSKEVYNNYAKENFSRGASSDIAFIRP